MAKKHLTIYISLFWALSLSGLQAQNLYVKQSNGTQTSVSLTDIRKMTFSEGNIIIAKTDNSSAQFALNDLRYLSFFDFSTSASDGFSEQGGNLKIFPNPVHSTFFLELNENTDTDGILNIYNFEGRLMLSMRISGIESKSINISHFPKGMYICHFSSPKGIKTAKIIKQ